MYFRTGKGKGTRPAARFPPAHQTHPPQWSVRPGVRVSVCVRACRAVPSRAVLCYVSRGLGERVTREEPWLPRAARGVVRYGKDVRRVGARQNPLKKICRLKVHPKKTKQLNKVLCEHLFSRNILALFLNTDSTTLNSKKRNGI